MVIKDTEIVEEKNLRLYRKKKEKTWAEMACNRWVKNYNGVVKKVEERLHIFGNSNAKSIKSLSKKRDSVSKC